MTVWRSILLTVALGGATGCQWFATATPLTTPQSLAENAMAPAYQQWVDRSHALLVEAQRQCQQPATPDVERVREAWRNAALSWSNLQSMQPGPVTPISVRVSYWPDKKDLTGHQVQLWLRQPVPTVAQLTEQSVTLQGLSALEYLLFDARFKGRLAAESERLCPRITVIAERQQQLAQEALQGWQDEQAQGLRLPVPNMRYATESEALADVLRANVSGLELAHKKLMAALGEKHPQPFLAEYWRSGLSLRSARAVIEGSQRLWQAGLGAAVLAQQRGLAAQIDDAYTQVLGSPLLEDKAAPLTDWLKTADGRVQVKGLADQMKTLHLLYAREVSKTLDISLGINAHDGD